MKRKHDSISHQYGRSRASTDEQTCLSPPIEDYTFKTNKGHLKGITVSSLNTISVQIICDYKFVQHPHKSTGQPNGFFRQQQSFWKSSITRTRIYSESTHRRREWESAIPISPKAFSFLLKPPSYLLNLLGFYYRILLGYRLATNGLVIKGALVGLVKAVSRAKRAPTTTLKSSKTHFFSTHKASVSRSALPMILHFFTLRDHKTGLVVVLRAFHERFNWSTRRRRRRRFNRRHVFDFSNSWNSSLLLLHHEVSIAFGAKIVGDRASEEATIVGTKDRRFAGSVFGLVGLFLPALLGHSWRHTQD